MKKRVLIIMAMLVWIAGGTTLVAQWAEYHADVLPQDDPGGKIRESSVSLINGTSAIVADPDNQDNKLWKFDIDLDAADELKYTWYPSYYDPDDENSVAVPAPATFAVKSRWIDTAGYYCGFDAEIRETFKVQAKFVNKKGIKLRVKDWTLDSIYNMPEGFDVTEWHVLRLTVANGEWKVYIDEAETAYASGTSGKKVDKHVAIIGAFSEPGKAGVEVDWMGFIDGVANSPTDMPLPDGVFDPATSIRSSENSNPFNVYPNPARNLINLNLDSKFVNSGYELFNITGQIVKRGIILSETSQIDVSALNSGMYMIKVTGASQILSESFIVE